MPPGGGGAPGAAPRARAPVPAGVVPAHTVRGAHRRLLASRRRALRTLGDVGLPRPRAVVSSGLGGGSLIYANVALRKDPATFADDEAERWPVTYADLEPWYEAVEAMQGSAPDPSDREPYASTPKTNALLDAAARTGRHALR